MAKVKDVIDAACSSHNSASREYRDVKSAFAVECVKAGFLCSISESLLAIAIMAYENQGEEDGKK